MSQKCIFCLIWTGQVESDILYRNNSCFCVQDIDPKAPVHLLIIPAIHFTSLADIAQKDYPMLNAMFETAVEMAKRRNVINSGYRLIINQGSHSGQAVDHLHLHLLAGRQLASMG